MSVPGSGSADLLHWTTATTMKVLSDTTTTTKAVLQAVSDGQWWKRSLAYLRPLQVSEARVRNRLYGSRRPVGASLHLFPLLSQLRLLRSIKGSLKKPRPPSCRK